MKMTRAAVVLSVALMAACGGGKQDGVVKFRGLTPITSIQLSKDTRKVETSCPGCGTALEIDTAKCPKKKSCGAQISWKDSYPCGSCRGSGVCGACLQMEQHDGKCYNCKGLGILSYLGKTKVCPNCKEKKVCPLCAGNRKCDSCVGSGKVGKDVVKERAKKSLDHPPEEDDTSPLPPKDDKSQKTEEKQPDLPLEEKKQ